MSTLFNDVNLSNQPSSSQSGNITNYGSNNTNNVNNNKTNKFGFSLSPLVIIIAIVVVLGGGFGIYKVASGSSTESELIGYWRAEYNDYSIMLHFTESGKILLLGEDELVGDLYFDTITSANYTVSGSKIQVDLSGSSDAADYFEYVFSADSDDDVLTCSLKIQSNKLTIGNSNTFYKCDSSGNML